MRDVLLGALPPTALGNPRYLALGIDETGMILLDRGGRSAGGR